MGASPKPPRRRSRGERRRDLRSKQSNGVGGSSQQGKKPGGAPASSAPGKGLNWSGLFDTLKPVVLSGALAAAAKCSSGLGRDGGGGSPQGVQGQFDLYLMAHSWAPRFCCTNGKKCKQSKIDGITGVAPHGLWPAYAGPKGKAGRTYPQNCQRADDDHTREGHEWAKHGTCTLLQRSSYFAEEARLTEATVGPIAEAQELLAEVAAEGGGAPQVQTAELVEALGGEGYAAVMTDKRCRLAEITTCWARNANGTVGQQVRCPAHVLGSSRNSAVNNGCVQVVVDRAGSCSKVRDDMLAMLKRREKLC